MYMKVFPHGQGNGDGPRTTLSVRITPDAMSARRKCCAATRK